MVSLEASRADPPGGLRFSSDSEQDVSELFGFQICRVGDSCHHPLALRPQVVAQ